MTKYIFYINLTNFDDYDYLKILRDFFLEFYYIIYLVGVFFCNTNNLQKRVSVLTLLNLYINVNKVLDKLKGCFVSFLG